MALPVNPPAMPYVLREDLVGVKFVDGIAKHSDFWYWAFADRAWAVGPYRSRRAARSALSRYARLDLSDCETWIV